MRTMFGVLTRNKNIFLGFGQIWAFQSVRNQKARTICPGLVRNKFYVICILV